MFTGHSCNDFNGFECLVDNCAVDGGGAAKTGAHSLTDSYDHNVTVLADFVPLTQRVAERTSGENADLRRHCD